MLASNDGALRSLASSTLSVSDMVPPSVPLLKMLELLGRAVAPLKLWPKSSQGTGTNLAPAVALYDVELGGTAVVLVVERVALLVALASLVAPERARMAKSIRPDCGSTTISRTCPSAFPSDDFTVLPITWLARMIWPECEDC